MLVHNYSKFFFSLMRSRRGFGSGRQYMIARTCTGFIQPVSAIRRVLEQW